MKSRIVLDGSVALAWFFYDERNEYAEEIARQHRLLDYVVPKLWRWEIANTLIMGERRKRCTKEDVTSWLAYLLGMPFQYDDFCFEMAWDQSLEHARDHRLTVYDAAYLELAHRESIPLATLDLELKKAAEAAGVEVYRTDSFKNRPR